VLPVNIHYDSVPLSFLIPNGSLKEAANTFPNHYGNYLCNGYLYSFYLLNAYSKVNLSMIGRSS